MLSGFSSGHTFKLDGQRLLSAIGWFLLRWKRLCCVPLLIRWQLCDKIGGRKISGGSRSKPGCCGQAANRGSGRETENREKRRRLCEWDSTGLGCRLDVRSKGMKRFKKHLRFLIW